MLAFSLSLSLLFLLREHSVLSASAPLERQRDVLLEYMLFQFFHIEKNLSKDRKLVENGNKQLEDLDKSRDDVEKRFKKMKARQAKSHQKTLDLEKQLRQKERELRKKVRTQAV